MVIREGDRAHRPGNAISNLLNNDSTYLTDNESTTATAIDKRQYKREEGALRKTRPGVRVNYAVSRRINGLYRKKRHGNILRHGEKTEDLTISYSGGERKVTEKCNL